MNRSELLAKQQNAVADWLKLLVEPESVVELRALGVRRKFGNPVTVSGFYDDEHLAEMARDAVKLDSMSRGVYFTLNPLHRDLLSRCANRVDVAKRGESTSAEHVLRRRWLLIDVDPVRTSGISSNEAELEHAEQVARDVDVFLFDQGWPGAIRALSGNGYHWLYRIDLPTDDGGLVKRVLHALSAKCSTDRAKIDTSVFDPPRICKLYGTHARKGDSTTGRPHRLSKILDIPDELSVVTREQLEGVAAMVPPSVSTNPTNTTSIVLPKSSSTNSVQRARNYLAKIPPAISGQGGSKITFHAACVLVKGFALSIDDALPLLSEWNLRCEPPWTDSDLRHKLNDAEKAPGEVGNMLRSDSTSPAGISAAVPKLVDQRPASILSAGTWVRAKDRDNLGQVVSDDGGELVAVHFVSPSGDERTVELKREQLSYANGSSVVQGAIVSPPMLSVRDLTGGFKKLRPPLIHGLLREGETMNIIAATKIGKSWLATLLALDFATQRKWLGRFETAGGDVLIVDNELHAETSAYRIPAVATANMTHLDEYADHVFVMNLRGGLVSLPELAVILSTIDPGRFKLIILDAFYRFLPPGTDENDNGAMAALYNLLDQIAGKVQCSIVCIHHSSKGSQAGKSVTDVGSGAGSMSRAADCHVILRPHEQPNVVVMEAAARSWPPLEPLCLRWKFPIFSEDTSLDPTLLRPERPKRTAKSETEKTPTEPAWTHQRFAAEFVGEAPQLRDGILAKAVDAGLAERRAEKLFQYAEGAGLIHAWPNFVKNKRGFANVPPTIDIPEKNTHIPP